MLTMIQEEEPAEVSTGAPRRGEDQPGGAAGPVTRAGPWVLTGCTGERRTGRTGRTGAMEEIREEHQGQMGEEGSPGRKTRAIIPPLLPKQQLFEDIWAFLLMLKLSNYS